MVQQPDPRELQRVGSPKTHRLWTPRLQVWGPTSLPGQAQSPAWLGPTLSPPLRGLHPGLYLWAFWGEGRLGGSTPHPPLGVQGCPQDPISQTWRVGWGGDRPRPSSWWQLWGPLSGLLETVPGACGRLEPSGRASSGGELRTRGAPRQSPLSKESASLSLHPGQKQQCRRGRGAGRPRTSLSVCCFHSSQTPDHPPIPTHSFCPGPPLLPAAGGRWTWTRERTNPGPAGPPPRPPGPEGPVPAAPASCEPPGSSGRGGSNQSEGPPGLTVTPPSPQPQFPQALETLSKGSSWAQVPGLLQPRFAGPQCGR